jgi:hypothetical protein
MTRCKVYCHAFTTTSPLSRVNECILRPCKSLSDRSLGVLECGFSTLGGSFETCLVQRAVKCFSLLLKFRTFRPRKRKPLGELCYTWIPE